ncbi:MAG: hypothetical protein ACI4T5_01485 [Prevotella sp.]
MAIYKNGDYSGSIGGVVYQNSMGKKIAREKPAHYHDRKSPEQIEQRSKLKRVTELYAQFKHAVAGCFESREIPTRDYDRFKKLNMNSDTIIVSEGSLPPLECKWEDRVLSFEMIKNDWQPLDILRLISLDGGSVKCIDTIINTPENCIYRSQQLAEGLHAFVHLRERKSKRMASSQHLTKYPE